MRRHNQCGWGLKGALIGERSGGGVWQEVHDCRVHPKSCTGKEAQRLSVAAFTGQPTIVVAALSCRLCRFSVKHTMQEGSPSLE